MSGPSGPGGLWAGGAGKPSRGASLREPINLIKAGRIGRESRPEWAGGASGAGEPGNRHVPGLGPRGVVYLLRSSPQVGAPHGTVWEDGGLCRPP